MNMHDDVTVAVIFCHKFIAVWIHANKNYSVDANQFYRCLLHHGNVTDHISLRLSFIPRPFKQWEDILTRLIYTAKNTSYLVIIIFFLLGLHHNNTVGEVGSYQSLGNYVFISKRKVVGDSPGYSPAYAAQYISDVYSHKSCGSTRWPSLQ